MIETITRDISKASEGTTSVGENPSVNGDVTSDCEAKEHCLLKPKTDNLIYREDVVRCNDGSLLGVVTEVAGDSYSESSITDDDDDSDGNQKEKEGEREEVAGKKRDGNVETKGDNKSEHVEAIESSVYQDVHKRDSLIADHVRVLWMDDSETTYHRNELTVVDRGFLQGDYVSFASDPTGQVGVVVNVNLTVDLLAPDGSTFKGVSSRDLKRIRNIAVGDYVISGPWLGKVDGVLDNVTVMFEDGSVCKIRGAELLHLRPIAKNLLEDGHCPYHPGQRVKARSSSIFKNGQWLSGKWRGNRLEGTVIKVTVGSVYVHWIASAGYGPDSSVSPAEEQSPRNLKLLSCFSHANWQLSDWCFFPSSSTTPLDKGLSKLQLQGSEEVILEETDQNVASVDLDGAGNPGTSDCVDGNALSCVSPKTSSSSSSPTVSNENIKENSHIRRKKSRKIVVKGDKKLRKKFENYEKALLIVNTHTKVDVAWQDGTLEQGLESSVLIPIVSPSDHDFVAEQYVMEKEVDDDDEDTSEIRRVGVIRSVDAKAKTACVNWLKQVSQPEDPREFEKEEIVSVYELEGHPDYDYCYGDVVVRLSPAMERVYSDFGEKHTNSNVSDDLNGFPIIEFNDKEGESFEEACNDSSDLPWVGNITGLRNGDIEVTWADGMVSTVGPQAIYVVGRDDDEESIVAGSDISAVASWETLEDDEMNIHDNIEKEQTPEVAGNNPVAGEETASRENISVTNGPLGFAYEILRMASEMFSRGPSNGDSETSGENELRPDEEMHISDGRVSSNVSDSQNPGVFGDGLTTPNNGEISTNVEALCNLMPNGSIGEICSGGNFCSFNRFETAKDPSDHVFLGSYMPSNSSRKWLKKVQSDWGILQHNLPDGIYVHVYEDRMDLLRAVIVGAYGTPYQDGLFFFDFHLSPEYPDAPPLAHYHSGGWRINPNLYEEGKVCLSLLNTWTGRGNEVWDPQFSSILQVLVSLQGLVLNSEPYYNEAGYDKQIGTTEGAKNSLSYNENTFLLNCKMIMFLIRKPPKDFEELVKEHFMQRGYYILKACDAYMKGYLIGTLAKDASVTNKSVANATSVGFKLMLAKLLPKLISSLDKVGADCHEFKQLQEP